MEEDRGLDQHVSAEVTAPSTFSAGTKCHRSNDCTGSSPPENLHY